MSGPTTCSINSPVVVLRTKILWYDGLLTLCLVCPTVSQPSGRGECGAGWGDGSLDSVTPVVPKFTTAGPVAPFVVITASGVASIASAIPSAGTTVPITASGPRRPCLDKPGLSSGPRAPITPGLCGIGLSSSELRSRRVLNRHRRAVGIHHHILAVDRGEA